MARCVDCFHRTVRFPEKLMSKLFYNYGKIVAKYPWPVLIVGFLIQALLALGLIRLSTGYKEADTVDAFIARGTWLWKERQQFVDTFDIGFDNYWPAHLYDLPEFYILYIQAKNDTNILNTQGMAEILNYCRTFETVSAEIDGQTIVYQDVCAKYRGDCVRSFECDSLLALSQAVVNPASGFLYASLSPLLSIFGQEFGPLSVTWVWGNTSTETVISSATHLALYSYVKRTDQGEKWSAEVFQQLDTLRKTFTNANYYLYSYAQGRKEDSDLRDDTIPLLGGCVAVIFVYCCVATFNLKVKGNRVILTLAGLISSAVSIAGAFGVMLAAEVPLVSISIIIPFIVAGIGIDAALVLSTEWASLSPANGGISDPVERVGVVMERAFVGVTLSHLTSVIAFLVGLVSPFPAVDYLCGYMAVCITFSWFGEATVFLSCLCIHSRWAKQDDDHSDHSKPEQNGTISADPPSKTQLTYDSSPVEVMTTNDDLSVIESLLMWFLPRFVINKYIKTILIFGLGVGAGLAIISVYNIPRTELYSIYYEDDSSIGEFYDARRTEYPFTGRIQVLLDKELDYSSDAVRQTIRNFYADFTATGFYEEPSTYWIPIFEQGMAAQNQTIFYNNEAIFNQQVYGYFQALGSTTDGQLRYIRFLQDDIVFANPPTDLKIVRSRIYISLTASTTGDAGFNEEILDATKDVLDKYEDSLNVYCYSFVFSEFERNILLRGEVWISVSIVAVVAMVVTLFFIPSLTVYFLVIFSFFSAMVSAMGLMGAWNLTYSLATYIQIMLGFGLCIDYMAHMARGYMVAEGDSPRHKVKATLATTGVAMTNAVVTSVLGIVMLSAAPSFAARTFFRSMFLIYLCSYVFGVWLLAAVLSILTPVFLYNEREDKKRSGSVTPEEILEPNTYQNGAEKRSVFQEQM
ncbi:patched domain-containing protein 3-like isoform X2 [Convolutriloba macropyga]